MHDKIDFKALWSRQKSVPPDLEGLMEQTDKFKKKQLTALFKLNGSLLLTAVFIGFIWYYFQPEMITTKIGSSLVILAIFMFLFAHSKMYPLLVKPEFELSNKQYLHQLLQLKKRISFLQNTMLRFYFILLTAGICLYLIEYAMRMDLPWALLTYLVTLAWLAFNWFYFRPKTIKKQNAAIDELIDRFEKLNEQFENEQTL